MTYLFAFQNTVYEYYNESLNIFIGSEHGVHLKSGYNQIIISLSVDG